MPENPGFQRRIERIERLVQELDSIADPSVQGTARELVESLMDLHAAAFSNVLETVSGAGEAGAWLLDRMERDNLVGSLLVLYGLNRADFEVRVQRAVEKLQPVLSSHGATVELLEASEGSVRLRLRGSATVKSLVENAIYETAPDTVTVAIEEAQGAANFVPVAMLLGNGRHAQP